MAADGEGFLGRWARRKAEVRIGQPPAEPPTPAPAPTVLPAVPPGADPSELAGDAAQDQAPAAGHAPEVPLPTLEDVRALTSSSDFKPFMAQGVPAEVKNAAMKKLFTDPHYNVMDGLDIYIDDYSKADPIPEAMLRNMVSAKVLKLFETAEEEAPTAAVAQAARPVRDDAYHPEPQSVAQSYESTNIATPPAPPGDAGATEPAPIPPAGTPHDGHTDLRLQPDDASRPRSVGRGTE